MANERRGKILQIIQDNYVAVSTVLVIFLLFIPIPKVLIDLCMIANLAFSIIIMLSVIATPRASDFQTFPRIILFQTMFSLGINIASTRLILLGNASPNSGYSNEQSAMVQAFARIVAGDNIVIGFVIFIILIVVQVLVVTKGAGRVSEVAARFSLDAMSQKFFDVDNRLNSGMIDDQEAMRLKDAIRKELDFYSNMDGSSKFVSGNVKAGVFITVVNLVGGFAMGVAFRKMSFQSALSTYSILTIGDGLMSQLPSIIISFATGILVTGTKSDEDLGEQLINDFTRSGYIYIIVGGVLAVAGIVLRAGTQYLLVPVGALFVFIGIRMSQKKKTQANAAEQAANEKNATNQSSTPSPDADKISMLDPLSLELGYGLIPLVTKEQGAELLERITRIRNEAKLDMGFVIPKIRIQDNMTLDPNDYSFKINGIERGHANIRLNYYMCMDTGAVITPLKGEKTKDPAFGMDAIWLPEDRRAEAEEAGYVVVDPPTIIATHLTEIIRAHAAEMLGRQEVSSIIETVKEKNSVLVDEVLNTANLNYGQIQKVLQNLLDENVSIRNIVAILETLANYASISKNPWDLTAKVRETLGLQICMQYADVNDKKLRVLRLSEKLSELVLEHAYYPPDGSKPYVAFDSVDQRKWISAISRAIASSNERGYQPIILCVSQVRQLVRSAVEREMPGVIVLSDMEIYAAGRSVAVEIIDQIDFSTEENPEMSFVGSV
ncbi:MAG: flagellar biosynthesis protein FlhA [Treponema sp.]|nr:flagellar biosynthesis protein FlhA [Treponema sp.]